MEQLEILCAANNQLKLIYVEGLSKLKRLATLDLHNNNIDFVPPQLGNVTQLRCFRISPGAGLNISSSWYIQKPVGLRDTAGLSNLEKITWIKLR
ncbi:hypothetical protein E2C01_030655 [Portunus trituberculatus]|uniref:Uncharacterized protein n=1 Tax=Portunus trituberculatus TaxID=210409 RepID=A0A5B7ERE5_PORTR|nr:hypothetical protein [Portunus trituberculatus]